MFWGMGNGKFTDPLGEHGVGAYKKDLQMRVWRDGRRPYSPRRRG